MVGKRGSVSTKVLNQAQGEGWALYQGDCVEVAKGIPENSVHFSLYSPPFSSLYTYSNSERDMGNCSNDETFWKHYRFLIAEHKRTTMPGRLVAVHCMNLPASKTTHGYIGLRDFRGDIIRAFVEAGFIYHSEVTIWKDPVTAMQRTKALGLLHKQIKKDSCMSRQGVPDYLVIFRKPGINPEPVSNTGESFPVSVWQRYASPVWASYEDIDEQGFRICVGSSRLETGDSTAINPSDTLQRTSAREERDERHICPLQLQVIERAIKLWSNPNDTVFSPFAGIGSEGYQAIRMGRRFVGIELKGSYYNQARLNLMAAVEKREQPTLFAAPEQAICAA